MRRAPERLYPYLEFSSQSADSEWSKAQVRCICGESTFKICHNGLEKKNLFGHRSLFVKDDGHLSVTAQCLQCSRTIKLFDSDLDACAESISEKRSEPSTPAVCPKCGHNEWATALEMEYPSGDSEDENDMQWIRISIQCKHCGHFANKYLDVEVE